MIRSGFQKMTIEAVATEAAIGKGSVYLHFDSKEELALSCIDRMVEDLLGQLSTLAAQPRPAAQRLHDMLLLRVMHRFDYARRHAHSIDQKLATMRTPLLARRAEHFRREAAVFRELLTGAPEPGPMAEALVTATNALLPYSLSVRELGRRADLSRRAEQVVRVLVAGIRFLNPHSDLRPQPRRRSS
ncbi:MAG: TetR/AcrR family transcriptional regulator [Candidatus Eisenbacteria bacterium]